MSKSSETLLLEGEEICFSRSSSLEKREREKERKVGKKEGTKREWRQNLFQVRRHRIGCEFKGRT